MKTFKSFVTEAEDTVTKDKSGKVVSWEHKGDWKKSDRKNPVGKIHNMSDVARRKTEKMTKEEVEQIDEISAGLAGEVARRRQDSASSGPMTATQHRRLQRSGVTPPEQANKALSRALSKDKKEGGSQGVNAFRFGRPKPTVKPSNVVKPGAGHHLNSSPIKKPNATYSSPSKIQTNKSSGVYEEVDQIDEVAAWQRSEGKNPEGGLNKKGIESYRREHPGSKLSLAVTTKPSKLKKGSKAWNRRKSFCSRMSGMKKRLTSAKTAHDPDSRINKSLRKWNC